MFIESSFLHKAQPIEFDKYNLDKWVDHFNSWPCIRHLELSLAVHENKIIVLTLPEVKEYHLGGKGLDAVNGACISGIMDTALAVSGFLQFPDSVCGTISVSVNLLRAVYTKKIIAYGRAIKKAKNVAFCEAELYTSEGKLCVTANGIVAKASK